MFIWYYILPIIIICLLVILFLKYKKSNAQIISKQLTVLRKELKLEDFKILNCLVESAPNYINYAELLDVYPDHLSYESKKKKTRQTVLTLEDYLSQKLKLKPPVFEFRKNIEDRREKQIRIR